MHPSARPVAVINPEALSRFSLSCVPGKITDAFNSLARKSNFRAISKKLGLVRPRGAAALPVCPLVPEELCSACARVCRLRTPRDTYCVGPELLLPLQSAEGLLLWTGSHCGFLVCPDPGPHQRGGGPGLTSLPTNAVGPAPGPVLAACSCLALGGSSVALALGRWRNDVSDMGPPLHSLPRPGVGWPEPRRGGAEACSGCLSLLTCLHLRGVGEAPSRLVLYPECHVSLQIPRVDGEYDLKMPRDMAYVFSGAYVPLSCKIIEQVGSPAAGEHRARPPKPSCLPGGPAGVPLPRAGRVRLLVVASLR